VTSIREAARDAAGCRAESAGRAAARRWRDALDAPQVGAVRVVEFDAELVGCGQVLLEFALDEGERGLQRVERERAPARVSRSCLSTVIVGMRVRTRPSRAGADLI
jgi:hypothetical protein